MSGKRFVPTSTIMRRMDRKDLRFQAEARRTAAARAVVEVAIVPPDALTPVLEVTLEPTGADVFGEPVPGEAVSTPDFDPCADYTPRGRFARRLDGRPVRLHGPQGRPDVPRRKR